MQYTSSLKSIEGTSLKGTVEVCYEDLVRLFGPPDDGDLYKTSGEWLLEDEHGVVVTIYDWKSTNLYDSDLPSVAEFRVGGRQEFHVGSRSKDAANRLIAYISTNI